MNTIKDFLESPLYNELIKHFSLCIPLLEEMRIADIERLKDRLKKRQLLVEGSDCRLHTEEQQVQWYNSLIAKDKEQIIRWITSFWQHSNKTKEKFPDGEFPKGEEPDKTEASTLVAVGKLARSCFAMYMIEFEILKNHPDILADYYKRIRIPGAAKYAREMKKLYNITFAM